jgi:hypothetical protein
VKCSKCGNALLHPPIFIVTVVEASDAHTFNVCAWCISTIVGVHTARQLRQFARNAGWVQERLPSF